MNQILKSKIASTEKTIQSVKYILEEAKHNYNFSKADIAQEQLDTLYVELRRLKCTDDLAEVKEEFDEWPDVDCRAFGYLPDSLDVIADIDKKKTPQFVDGMWRMVDKV